MYFSDPLLSRLAHLIAPGHPDPDITVRSENGIALALARTAEQIRPGSFRSEGSVMYFKPKRAEIDFVGIEPDTGVGFMPIGEWPGGISPPGSLRTVREPLDSHGSHYRARLRG